MAHPLYSCPPGVDLKDWMPLYGCTRKAWYKMISGEAKRWWNSLPAEKRKEWNHAFDESFGHTPVEDPE